MVIAAGVELREKEKQIKGPKFQLENRMSLQDFHKGKDPNFVQQQIALKEKEQQKASEKTAKAARDETANEGDPYRDFRMFVIRSQIPDPKARTTSNLSTKKQPKQEAPTQSYGVKEEPLATQNCFHTVTHGVNQRAYQRFMNETVTPNAQLKASSSQRHLATARNFH